MSFQWGRTVSCSIQYLFLENKFSWCFHLGGVQTYFLANTWKTKQELLRSLSLRSVQVTGRSCRTLCINSAAEKIKWHLQHHQQLSWHLRDKFVAPLFHPEIFIFFESPPPTGFQMISCCVLTSAPLGIIPGFWRLDGETSPKSLVALTRTFAFSHTEPLENEVLPSSVHKAAEVQEEMELASSFKKPVQ